MTENKTAIMNRLEQGVLCGRLTPSECKIVENERFTVKETGRERMCVGTRELITGTLLGCRNGLFVEQKSTRRS